MAAQEARHRSGPAGPDGARAGRDQPRHFRALPSDRTHDYLRSLLAAVGVLAPFEIRIERTLAWLGQITSDLPHEHAHLVQQFAHWRVLRDMRRAAREDRLTQGVANHARSRVRGAIAVLAFFDQHGATARTASQDLLERYQEHVGRRAHQEYTFIAWLRDTRMNTRLSVAYIPRSAPAVSVSEERRWAAVDRLLHDQTLRRYTRIGGLLTLLFAQPLSRIVAMRTSQVATTGGAVHLVLNKIPLQLPPVLDDLVREHLTHRGKSLYASRDNGWLFPGGNPGHHLVTENIRSQLVAIGIRPYEARKAALFQLAAEMPAPVLAELIGITDKNAADWARLAARDWTGYIAARAHRP